MRTDKYNRMLKQYDGFKGYQTISAILDQIPVELKMELTGRQLGFVMGIVNKAYHKGRTSMGAEVIEGDSIWINSLNCLIELNDIKKLVNNLELKAY